MKWFGSDWGAPVCKDTEHVPVPVGAPCAGCEKAIEPGDNGLVLPFHGGPGDPEELAYHHRCLMSMLGLGRQ